MLYIKTLFYLLWCCYYIFQHASNWYKVAKEQNGIIYLGTHYAFILMIYMPKEIAM